MAERTSNPMREMNILVMSSWMKVGQIGRLTMEIIWVIVIFPWQIGDEP